MSLEINSISLKKIYNDLIQSFKQLVIKKKREIKIDRNETTNSGINNTCTFIQKDE